MQKKKKADSNNGKTGNVKSGEGTFNFLNGDAYEGNYVVINKSEIYRQDYGIYRTNDGDAYEGFWDKDCVALKIRIKYSNKAEYAGETDAEGSMNGRGTYTFPDGTSLKATWENNEPEADYVYRDPLGYEWIGRLSINEQKVYFSPEHHLWD